MKSLFYTLLVIMLTYASTSFASFYKWVDDEGNAHFTTAPPPDASKHGRELIGEGGRVLKTVQGQLSVKEKAAIEKKALAQKQAVKNKADQKRKDRVLLGTYQTVDDIAVKRDTKLSKLGQYIESLERDRDTAGQEYENLMNEAIAGERAGNLPSEKLKSELRSAKRDFDNNETHLEKAKSDLVKAKTLFDEDIKRFSVLKEG